MSEEVEVITYGYPWEGRQLGFIQHSRMAWLTDEDEVPWDDEIEFGLFHPDCLGLGPQVSLHWYKDPVDGSLVPQDLIVPQEYGHLLDYLQRLESAWKTLDILRERIIDMNARLDEDDISVIHETPEEVCQALRDAGFIDFSEEPMERWDFGDEDEEEESTSSKIVPFKPKP